MPIPTVSSFMRIQRELEREYSHSMSEGKELARSLSLSLSFTFQHGVFCPHVLQYVSNALSTSSTFVFQMVMSTLLFEI